MRIYYNNGNRDDIRGLDNFIEFCYNEGLKYSTGVIESAKILERKRFSNEGNALDGMIKLTTNGTYDGFGHIGLNIGQNPIGTGLENYGLFLDELKCRKNIFGLYDVNSIVGSSICILMNENNSQGIFTFNSLFHREKTQLGKGNYDFNDYKK